MTTNANAVPTASVESTERAHTIAGLRALADFLEGNPTVPIARLRHDYSVFISSENDDDGRAEVDRIAVALGVPVLDETADGGHYRATKSFGHIRYAAVYVPARRRAAYAALTSYAPAFDNMPAA